MSYYAVWIFAYSFYLILLSKINKNYLIKNKLDSWNLIHKFNLNYYIASVLFCWSWEWNQLFVQIQKYDGIKLFAGVSFFILLNCFSLWQLNHKEKFLKKILRNFNKQKQIIYSEFLAQQFVMHIHCIHCSIAWIPRTLTKFLNRAIRFIN